MCGFAGFIDTREAGSEAELAERAREMAATLTHRGPDDSDAWTDPVAGIALGHRRLSILDLSQHGHQPMHSHSGRYVIAYNGELYNFGEIRAELEGRGQRFLGHSDTEVLLAAIDAWGVRDAVRRCTGMFAFALWDRQRRELSLVRDRIGEKPLYYGRCGAVLLFGSELKALRRHAAWDADVDRDALAMYMRFGYVPAPWSIYRGIRKLLPGTILTLEAHSPDSDVIPVPYWSLSDVAAAGTQDPFRGSDEDAIDELERLLSRAVRRQMIADVPLGAFLSGGVDSSTIVALAQAAEPAPLHTFTIGYSEAEFNEADYAREVARHLHTVHTELSVSPAEAMAVIPLLPRLYDEPFSDSSQIPTYLVSRLAREQVTVSLSGDGGDELFGGYNRYLGGPRIWRTLERTPRAFRRAAAHAITGIGGRRFDLVGAAATRVLGPRRVPSRIGDKMMKVGGVLGSDDRSIVYKTLVSAIQDPNACLVQGTERSSVLDQSERWPRLRGFTDLMMYLDAVTYLPDDILVKVDRASMGCSLESRAPYLDHHVVEFAWRLPLEMKFRGGFGKWILRQLLYRYLPKRLVERPKMGFGIPVGEWLRGPLRDWGDSLIDPHRLQREGYLEGTRVRQLWEEHQSRRHDRTPALWAVLMFQAWAENERAEAQSLRETPG